MIGDARLVMSITIPADLKRRLRQRAAVDETSMSSVVERALLVYLVYLDGNSDE